MESYTRLVEQYRPGVSPHPGAAEALAEATGLGLACALVSGSSRRWNGPLLRMFDLERFLYSPPCPCGAPRSMKTPARGDVATGRGGLLRSPKQWCGTMC